LTVSSLVVGQGEPPVLAGVISQSTDLADAVSTSSARFVVQLVGAGQRRLAQHFAGELPAPPELLATELTPHGPVLEALADRMFCRVTSSKPFGWSLLVEAEVTDVEVGEQGKALAWYHGAFHEVGS
jgi:flavin reductase (DIM6/NTAB) family NADH-FMN oxidoreductase RutF